MTYIALSAAKRDPRKYRWLQYDGRKATFQVQGSDKEEYELSLKKGEKFGVKRFRGNFYIVDESDLTIQLRLKPEDAKRIINNSKAFEGKIGRYKVLPYDGGKDKESLRKKRTDSKGRKRLIMDSSMFSDALYDPKSRRLIVKFKNGAVWEYDDVSPKEVRSFERASSQGKWFNRHIKGLKPEAPGDSDTPNVSLSATKGEYKSREVTLEKPFRLPKGSKKKFGVYVMKDDGTVILVKFGDPNMEIKRDDPKRRKSFMARHKCDTKKDKTTPGYWSCKAWELSADWV